MGIILHIFVSLDKLVRGGQMSAHAGEIFEYIPIGLLAHARNEQNIIKARNESAAAWKLLLFWLFLLKLHLINFYITHTPAACLWG